MIAAVVVGFAALIALRSPEPVLSFIPGDPVRGHPAAHVAVGRPAGWTAIFRRVGGRDVLVMIGFAALNVVVTFALGAIVAALTDATANPEAGVLADASTLERVVFYPQTAIQLLGEELLTILPFLALCTSWSPRPAGRASLPCCSPGSSRPSGSDLVHLPTYDWNVLQCIVVIGGARVILTLAYIREEYLSPPARAF